MKKLPSLGILIYISSICLSGCISTNSHLKKSSPALKKEVYWWSQIKIQPQTPPAQVESPPQPQNPDHLAINSHRVFTEEKIFPVIENFEDRRAEEKVDSDVFELINKNIKIEMERLVQKYLDKKCFDQQLIDQIVLRAHEMKYQNTHDLYHPPLEAPSYPPSKKNKN